MSKIILHIKLILFFVLGFYIQNAQAENYSVNNISNYHNENRGLSKTDINKSDIVYVCFGDYSEKYHSRSNCTGLNNCKGELIQ